MTITLIDQAPSVSTTPISLVAGTSSIQTQTDKVAASVMLDLSALAGSDVFRLSLLEKITAAGTQRTVSSWYFQGTQEPSLFVSPSFVLGHGWDWTLTKISGTDRTIESSIRQLSGAIFTFSDNSATIGATEYGLPNASTTLTDQTDEGVYSIFIDGANVTSADRFVFALYEKVRSASTRRNLITPVSLSATNHFATPALILKHGWQATLRKATGTDRSIAWSIRKVA